MAATAAHASRTSRVARSSSIASGVVGSSAPPKLRDPTEPGSERAAADEDDDDDRRDARVSSRGPATAREVDAYSEERPRDARIVDAPAVFATMSGDWTITIARTASGSSPPLDSPSSSSPGRRTLRLRAPRGRRVAVGAGALPERTEAEGDARAFETDGDAREVSAGSSTRGRLARHPIARARVARALDMGRPESVDQNARRAWQVRETHGFMQGESEKTFSVATDEGCRASARAGEMTSAGGRARERSMDAFEPPTNGSSPLMDLMLHAPDVLHEGITSRLEYGDLFSLAAASAVCRDEVRSLDDVDLVRSVRSVCPQYLWGSWVRRLERGDEVPYVTGRTPRGGPRTSSSGWSGSLFHGVVRERAARTTPPRLRRSVTECDESLARHKIQRHFPRLPHGQEPASFAVPVEWL